MKNISSLRGVMKCIWKVYFNSKGWSNVWLKSFITLAGHETKFITPEGDETFMIPEGDEVYSEKVYLL